MTDVPQFDLPFRFDDGREVVVEQDSLDDIANSVEALLRTRVGDRDGLPRFGTPDLVFAEQPILEEPLIAQIRAWEPRVDVLIQQDRDRFDETLVRLQITVLKEPSVG